METKDLQIHACVWGDRNGNLVLSCRSAVDAASGPAYRGGRLGGLSAGAHASFKGCCACSSNSATDQGERYERASICRDHHRNTLHFTTACGCTKARRRGPRTRKKERHVTFLRVCGAIFTCGSLVYLARSGACKPCFALTKPARDFADRDKASVPAVRRRRYTTDRNSVRYPHDTRPEHGHRW